MDLSVLGSISGSSKPTGGGGLPDEEEAGGSSGEVVMQEYLDAQATGDIAGAWAAFQSMVALAQSAPVPEE